MQMEVIAAIPGEDGHVRCEIEEIKGPKGRSVFLIAILPTETLGQGIDARLLNREAWAGVIIRKFRSGHVIITAVPVGRLKLDDVARMIRRREQLQKGRLVTTNWTELSRWGAVAGAPEWYYNRNSGTLSNEEIDGVGTMTPTRLSVPELQMIVRIALDENDFESTRTHSCTRGVCTSSTKDECPWHQWGLARCRRIRWQMRQTFASK